MEMMIETPRQYRLPFLHVTQGTGHTLKAGGISSVFSSVSCLSLHSQGQD